METGRLLSLSGASALPISGSKPIAFVDLSLAGAKPHHQKRSPPFLVSTGYGHSKCWYFELASESAACGYEMVQDPLQNRSKGSGMIGMVVEVSRMIV